MQWLLRGVGACLDGFDQFTTTDLSLLKTKNCEAHCCVAHFGDLLDGGNRHHGIWIETAEVKRGEVNRVKLRKSDLWNLNFGEFVERQFAEDRSGDLGEVDGGERDMRQLRHGASVLRGANCCKHSATCRMSQGLEASASGGIRPRTSLAGTCQSHRFPLPSPPWWPLWSSTNRATG